MPTFNLEITLTIPIEAESEFELSEICDEIDFKATYDHKEYEIKDASYDYPDDNFDWDQYEKDCIIESNIDSKIDEMRGK